VYFFICFLVALFLYDHYKLVKSNYNLIDENIKNEPSVQLHEEPDDNLISSKSSQNLNQNCMATHINLNFKKWKTNAAKYQHPSCDKSNFITINDNGTINFEYDYLNKNNILLRTCQLNVVKWGGDDFKALNEKSRLIKHNDKVDINEEFFTIKCKTNKGLSKITGKFFAFKQER